MTFLGWVTRAIIGCWLVTRSLHQHLIGCTLVCLYLQKARIPARRVLSMPHVFPNSLNHKAVKSNIIMSLGSPLYLEFKFARLLLQPLEDPHPLSRFGICGYSRQSNGTGLSSLPNNPPNAGHQQSHPSPNTESHQSHSPSAPIRLMPRIMNHTQSAPAGSGYILGGYPSPLLEQHKNIVLNLYKHGTCEDFNPDSTTQSCHLQECSVGAGTATPLDSFPTEDLEMTRTEGQCQCEWDIMDEPYSTSEEEEIFLQQHNLTRNSLQHLKEQSLGTREGLGRFITFLEDTLGIHLLHFWMDCEEFRERVSETEASPNPEETRHLSAHLYRFIQNKYLPYLTAECQEQIRLSQQNWGPTFPALRRSQYDALRRLRSYWVPRFLIHQKLSLHRRLDLISPYTETIESEPQIQLGPNKQSPGTTGRGTEGGKNTSTWTGLQCGSSHSSLVQRMIRALMSDCQAGSPFLHFLSRFDSQKRTQMFLLCQALAERDIRGSEDDDSSWEIQMPKYRDPIWQEGSLEYVAEFWEHLDHAAGDMQSLAWGSIGWMELGALCESWLCFLRYDVAQFLEHCVPTLNQDPKTSLDLSPRGDTHKRTKKGKASRAVHFREGKPKHQRKTVSFIQQGQDEAVCGYPINEPPDSLEMLENKAVYKVYRKVIQDTEEPATLKALETLQALKGTTGGRKMLRLVEEVLELESIQRPLLKGLRKRLVSDLLKARVSSPSLEGVIDYLHSCLSQSFGQFWEEMVKRLKECGVDQPGNENWARLEPILQVFANKMIMSRLHGTRTIPQHSAQAQPTSEDKTTFRQALYLASQGWPTSEVLHFLSYLQTHSAQEGHSLLENNLLCCLEVQKYKNAHHAMPDQGLLRTKVRVIRERFLLPHPNHLLELDPHRLQAYLQESEAALVMDQPSLSIFDGLQDSLCGPLLPFWAGFRKLWLLRSSASARRKPVLRAQQILHKRLAQFESAETPLKTFHLPPVQHSSSMVSFSFSISHGVTVKENQDLQSIPASPAEDRASQDSQLPQLSRSSSKAKQLHTPLGSKTSLDSQLLPLSRSSSGEKHVLTLGGGTTGQPVSPTC
ncbi:uncharacterized protein LOC108716562 isoform X2 [Xenopus laevis]|uniref:Uncharacterized protein LOC108716562 isoform X2 n=1 Tax=Xenopus laevis TaxID=8355 RepID=A0A8J0VB57_XENLA|nr:uncharacterized protein LOC108716562 isoform X2 [Xenopus laevis]